MSVVKVRDLPTSTLHTGEVLICTSPDCEMAYEPFSASRGDYWMLPDDEPINCDTCLLPLDLARRVVTWKILSD